MKYNQLRRANWISWTFFGLIVSAFLGPLAYFYFNIDLPIKYSVGNIDPRFNISESQLLDQIGDSEIRWENYLGRDIFQYDSSAKMKINLVYDERQSKIDQLKEMNRKIDVSDNIILDAQSELKKDIAEYESDLADYNARVNHWNSLGGAPSGVYEALQKEQQKLEKRRIDINTTAEALNFEIDNFNQDLSELNSELEKEQGKLVIEGIYSSLEPKIDIYAYSDLNQLRLTIMHELGHSMGLVHGEDPLAIMYPVLEKQDFLDPNPNATDKASFAKRYWFKIEQLAQYGATRSNRFLSW